MERKIIITKDGSPTVSIPEMQVTYHSLHGAIQESMHVFIEAGLKHCLQQHHGEQISVFEMGFGTGLNALLTLIEAEKEAISVYYETIEQFPLTAAETDALNYCQLLNDAGRQPLFQQLHQCEWETPCRITNHFTFLKRRDNLSTYIPYKLFNLIYYDAFAPAAQPALWTKDIFEKLFDLLEPGGMLVTYCSKSIVRRAMQAAGFTVNKIPGPPGKREMVRCEK